METNRRDLLDDIIALYDSNEDPGSIRMCILARMCRKILHDDVNELDIWEEYPEANALARRYIIKMYQILHEEKVVKDQKMGYETLFKLHRLLLDS